LELATLATGAQTIDETKPYGRTCLTVADSKTKTERLMTADLKSAAESTVAVHLEANMACEAIVAAFSTNDGTLANGWLPVIVRLEEREEQTAPPTHEPWAWVQTGNPFEVFVVFLPMGTPLGGKALGLLAKLREGKAARPVSAPAPVAATVRGWAKPKPLLWRDHARTTNFSAEKPRVIGRGRPR
jgi:hypothetical protein